jgi:UDP-glucose 4-epimerase
MHFIITGGLGYIGSHTVIQLCNAGHTVSIIDDCRNSKEETIDTLCELTGQDIPFYNIDITNKTILLCSLLGANDTKPDVIIHFAALKSVGDSTEQPLEYYQNNIIGLLNMLELAKQLQCPNFIFSSSCTVYPHFAPKPLTEQIRAEASNTEYETIVTGFSPYGTSKLMCEQILHDIAKSDQFWNIVILRYFNPVGNHKSGQIGDSFKISKNLNLFTAIVNNKIINQPVKVFGGTYPTLDGTAVRDYIHVMDVAEAHRVAAEWSKNKKGLEVFNIGTGTGYSVLEVINKFNEKGFGIRYEMVAKRKGDIAEVYADCAKAKNILGWHPKYCLDDMVEDTINYFLINQ